MRWRDPERGLVPPGEFIPLAERAGLMDALGEWVLRAACRQAAAWAEGLEPRIGLNMRRDSCAGRVLRSGSPRS